MGQKKPVTIYRLVSEGTIEEGMLVVAKEKLNLEKEVTSSGSGSFCLHNQCRNIICIYTVLFFLNLDAKKELKCMVRLLTMALGMDENKAEILLSPTKDTSSSSIINEYFTNE